MMTAPRARAAFLSLVVPVVLLLVLYLDPLSVWTDGKVISAGPALSNSASGGWQPIAVRTEPLRLPVRRDLESLVSDADLQLVLQAAVPRWNPPTVPIMLHSIRLWGTDARFPTPADVPPAIADCGAFRRILLNNDDCVRTVGKFDQFLIDTRYGVRVLTAGDPIKYSINSEGHYDQVLKALGECAVPATEKLTTAGGRVRSVADLVQDSIARFSLLQELEFTAIAYSRWLPPVREWHNRFGERYSFDDLVDGLVQQPLGAGACQGCHAPYALASILLASEEYPELLTDRARSKLRARLREISERLETNQVPGGGWDKRWSGEYVEKPENVFFEFKPHFDRISATGHHLEWIALVDAELRPRPVVIQRAARALVTEIGRLSDDDLRKPKGFLPMTHAARAICLTRGHDCGYPLWQELQAKANE